MRKITRLQQMWKHWIRGVHLMVGMQDYERYVKSRRCFSPTAPVMSQKEFFVYCQQVRYGGKAAKKCPC